MLNKPAYRIFISSTTADLADVRKLVVEAISQTGNIPLSMESWPSTITPTLDVICDEIGQCDIFVSIVGSMYGSIVRQAGQPAVSYTEFEYQYASALEKPILAFLLDEKLVLEQRNKIEMGNPERGFDNQFNDFRRRVGQTQSGLARLVAVFDSEAKLGIAITSSLHQLILQSSFNAPGLVPSDSINAIGLIPPDTIDPDAGLRELYAKPFLGQTVERLASYKLLFERLEEEQSLKRELARFFWQFCFPGICGANVSELFFESGSTLAYVAERFFDQTAEKRSWREHWPNVTITTNNILVFLQFLFTSSTVHVELRPQDRPDEKYGATYGPINDLLSLAPGQDEPLSDKPLGVLQDIVKHLQAPAFPHASLSNAKKLLILAAASGVNCVGSPPGPHVGSYRNKLFKRALLMTGAPIIFFVDESKFLEGKAYSKTKCFAVCGEQLSWETVLNEQSVAFCVGASSLEKASEVAHALVSIGLTHSSSNDPRGDYSASLPFLMSNERFAIEFSGMQLKDVREQGLLVTKSDQPVP